MVFSVAISRVDMHMCFILKRPHRASFLSGLTRKSKKFLDFKTDEQVIVIHSLTCVFLDEEQWVVMDMLVVCE